MDEERVYRTDAIRATLKEDISDFFNRGAPLDDYLHTFGYAKMIGMVNNGLNDFNSANNDICLSLLMTAAFFARSNDVSLLKHSKSRGGMRKKLLMAELKEDIGDILYIYRKLKTAPNKLNLPVLNAYYIEHPGFNPFEQLALMDKALKVKARKAKSKKPTSKRLIASRKTPQNA